MSEPLPIPPPEDLQNVDLKTLVFAFLDAIPEPTDEQLHAFSELLGIPYEKFEEEVFDIFKDYAEDALEDIEDGDDSVVDDPLDVLILAFFVYSKESPTEEQIHAFAGLLGITPEELEERVYRMLQDLDDEAEDEFDDEDEPEPGQD